MFQTQFGVQLSFFFCPVDFPLEIRIWKELSWIRPKAHIVQHYISHSGQSNALWEAKEQSMKVFPTAVPLQPTEIFFVKNLLEAFSVEELHLMKPAVTLAYCNKSVWFFYGAIGDLNSYCNKLTQFLFCKESWVVKIWVFGFYGNGSVFILRAVFSVMVCRGC